METIPIASKTQKFTAGTKGIWLQLHHKSDCSSHASPASNVSLWKKLSCVESFVTFTQTLVSGKMSTWKGWDNYDSNLMRLACFLYKEKQTWFGKIQTLETVSDINPEARSNRPVDEFPYPRTAQIKRNQTCSNLSARTIHCKMRAHCKQSKV